MLITLTWSVWRDETSVETAEFIYAMEDTALEWMRAWFMPGRSDEACSLCGVPFIQDEYRLLPYDNDSATSKYHTGLDMCLECAIHAILGPDVEIPESLIIPGEVLARFEDKGEGF